MVSVLQFNASSIQCIYVFIIRSIQPIAWYSVNQSVEKSANRNNSVVRVIKYIDGAYCVGSVFSVKQREQ